MEILIIGGIAAGMSIAAKAKRTNPDANVTVIEKEDYISFGACGLPYYIGNQFEDIERMYARSVEEAKEQGINILLKHEVCSIEFEDKYITVNNLESNKGFIMQYDKLAIATGAYPISALKEKAGFENQYNVTKPAEVEKLKDKLNDANDIVIIGGGFIGLEVAEQVAQLGKNVNLIQRSDRVMRKIFDEEFSEKLHQALEETGVKLHLNSPLKDYKIKGNRITEVITESASFKADMVIEALGFKPNTEFIDDERLRKLENGAIIIDEFGKTSIEGVYAAGDCATVYNRQRNDFYSALATYANKMGRLVGENIVSEKQKPFIGALSSAILRVGEYGAGSTGLTEEEAKGLGLDYSAQLVKTKNHASYWPGQSDIYIKLVYNKEDKKIIGGQVFGKYGAAERLQAITMAVYNGNTVHELGYMDFAYSPPFASTWDALNVAGNACK